jgi:hypothetical protein
MNQPFLDMMNYDKPECPSMYESNQHFLCNSPKTDGRFGFNPSSRFYTGIGVISALTPFGVQELERKFIQLISEFKVFNYDVMKALAMSCLPDAVVLNLVDNALNIMLEPEEGEAPEFVFTHCGYYSCHIKGLSFDTDHGWTDCGCDCLIEWNGRRKIVSLDVAQFLETSGRLRKIPFSERFVPRSDGTVKELKFNPHKGAIDRNGNRLCPDGVYIGKDND